MLKYAEHLSKVLRNILENRHLGMICRKQWKVSLMNYRIVLGLALFSISTVSFAASPCQEKEQEIKREISYAEKHNNQSRINGLKKALSEVQPQITGSDHAAPHHGHFRTGLPR
jgi:hypothetical protein